MRTLIHVFLHENTQFVHLVLVQISPQLS